MKLYALSLIAQRTKDGQTEISIRPFLVLHETEGLAQEEAAQIVQDVFPSSDGWEEQQIVAIEIEQGATFDDGKRLMWHIEEATQPTEAPDGENK